jgi:hypothetical protein
MKSVLSKRLVTVETQLMIERVILFLSALGLVSISYTFHAKATVPSQI